MLWLAIASAWLRHEMVAIHVAELAQPAQQRAPLRSLGLGAGHVGGRLDPEESDPINLARGLTGGDTGRREEPQAETADERSPLINGSPNPSAAAVWRFSPVGLAR
jgi:hypothetical protein